MVRSVQYYVYWHSHMAKKIILYFKYFRYLHQTLPSSPFLPSEQRNSISPTLLLEESSELCMFIVSLVLSRSEEEYIACIEKLPSVLMVLEGGNMYRLIVEGMVNTLVLAL